MAQNDHMWNDGLFPENKADMDSTQAWSGLDKDAFDEDSIFDTVRLKELAEEILTEEAEDPILPEAQAVEPAFPSEDTQLYDPSDFPDDAMPEEPVEETDEEDEEPIMEGSGRPKKVRSVRWFGIPHLLATAIWLAVILLIGATLGRTAWVYCSDLMAFGKPDQEITIQVVEDDDIADIAQKLSDAELIRYPELFKTFANLTKKSARIRAGIYTLNAKYDYNAIINAMIPKTTRQEVDVFIVEGSTCAQIFQLLEEKGVCTVEALEEYAANGELGGYWFLEGVTRGDRYCLEGYLFPDTYRFYTNDKPENVIAKMLNNFDYRFTDLMRERLVEITNTFEKMLRANGYGNDYVASHKITIREVVIIASMIERESANAEESHAVSGVIYNRLANAKSYPFLNIDATIVYALGGKKELTEEDKRLDSPYNTYLYKGLIPGPISNPGRDSLTAAMDPDASNYYYYALNPATNRHVFSKTYEEHQRVVASFKK